MDTAEKLRDDNALRTAIEKDGIHRIFILDGPSGCGKTRFINSLLYDRKLRIPANLLLETVFLEQRDLTGNKRMLLYFLTQLNCDILCVEDIDISLRSREATQEMFADMIVELAVHHTVLLTGNDIRKSCGTFVGILRGRYRCFRYTEQ